VVDVLGFNYRTDQIEAYHARHPAQPIYGSETGSTVATRGEYANDAKRHVVRAYDTEHPWWATTAEEWWPIVVTRPYIAGGFVWTGFDYRGEPTPYAEFPSISSQFGILDTCGFPKDDYYYYRAWWRPDQPLVHLLPHWNWPGREGKSIEVWAHGNTEEVELVLNGRSLGRKPMPRNRHLEWRVPYAPGRLEAIGTNGGQVAARDVRETTGPAHAVQLLADRRMARAGEVVILNAAVVDARGRVVPTASNLLRFSASGGRIIGVGNGNPNSLEPDIASQRKAFNGFAQAILRLGLTGTFEFKPTDALTSTIDGFYSNFKDDQIKRGIEVPLQWGGANLQPGYTTEDGVVTSGTFTNVYNVVRNVLQPKHAKLYSVGWNNRYDGPDGWHGFLDLSWNKTKRNELVFETYAGTGYNFSGPADTLGFETSETGTVITSHNLNYSDPNQIFITDPRGWGGLGPNGEMRPGYWNNRIVNDRIWQIHPELSKDLDTGFLSNVRLGLNYTDHKKSLTPDEAFVAMSDPTIRNLVVPSQYLLPPADFNWIGLGNTLAFDPQQLLNAGIYTLESNNLNPDVQAKAYDVHEKLGTIYLQADIHADLGSTQLTGNIGVQAVHTDQLSSGFVVTQVFPAGALTPASDGAKYWDVMPQMNLSFRFPNDWVIRAGLAREVQRPRMDSMRIANEYGVCRSGCAPYPVITGTAGNPELRPYRANAADLSFEKYFGVKGYISLQLFYKYFDTFVVEQNLPNVPFDYTGFPLPAPWQSTTPCDPTVPGCNYIPPQGITNGFIKHPYNISGGKMYGAELGATIPFGDFVPALDGFGMTGGVGYTQSRVHIYPGAPASMLPGYSKWVANGTLYFEKWGFNARGSVRYRSSFQGEVSGFAQNNVFRQAKPETIVDAQVGYDFQPGTFLNGLSIYLQALNLTNEPFVTTNPGQDLQVIDYQRYGRRWMLGATYKFGANSPPPPPPPPPAPPPPPPPAPATQTCADGSTILATDVCPAPPPPPPPPAPAPERGS
jgi:iron complex outermembrane receptor protein